MIGIRNRRWLAALAALALTTSGLAANAILATTPAQAAEIDVDNAVFTWELNKESTGGAFAPGTWNLFSAGKLGDPGSGFQLLNSANEGATWTNGAVAGWTNNVGNVTVEDKQADGSYAPTTFQGTRTDSTGAPVNTGSVVSENRISIASGTGTIDPETDSGTLVWDGDFTVVYYSGYSFFYVSDPTLNLTNGVGTISATLSGFGASMDDPTKWVTLAPTQVVMADVKNVDLTENGFTITPDYLGVTYDAPEGGTAQVRSGEHWGAFPKSWIDFQVQVGTSSYWYSSGGAVDPRKPTTPLSVSVGDLAAPEPTPAPSPEPSATPTPSPTARAKAGAAVVVNAKDGVYGDAVPVSVQVSSVQTPTGQVILSEGETVLGRTDLTGGTANFDIGALSAGSHQLRATYLGNETISAASVDTEVTVARAAVSLSPRGLGKVKAGMRAPLTLRLSGTPSGQVTVKVKASSTLNRKARVLSRTLSNGRVGVKLPRLARGRHVIVVKYAGDRNHQRLRTELRVRVR